MSAGSKKARTDDAAAAATPNNMMAIDDVESNLCFVLTNLFIGDDISALNDPKKSFLDSVDLIRLMCVSKATRKIVAPVLNGLEKEYRHQTERFRSELRTPMPFRRTGVSMTYARERDIQNMADKIQSRFAIVDYKSSYENHQSKVAIFDEKGAFICIYECQYNISGWIREVTREPLGNDMTVITNGTPPYWWDHYRREVERSDERDIEGE